MEQGTSNWYKAEKSPVLSTYEVGAPNKTLNEINLGVLIMNNNTKSLFNVQVEVSYKTAQGNWVTIKENKGFIDMGEHKQTRINLPNPYLNPWDAKRPQYTSSGTQWEYVTVYYFDSNDYKINVYGYAE